MHPHALRQHVQCVAAFEDRDNATLGVAMGHVEDAGGKPGIVAFHSAEIGEIVVAMGVEAGGNVDQLGAKGIQRRQQALLGDFSRRVASRARR